MDERPFPRDEGGLEPMRAIMKKTVAFLDDHPCMPSVVYLAALALAYVPVVIRVGGFCDSKLSPIDGLSDTAIVVLGRICDVSLLVSTVLGMVMFLLAFVMLVARHFRTAAKMFISSALAVFLTIALLVTTGPLLFVFGVETAEIEESASR